MAHCPQSVEELSQCLLKGFQVINRTSENEECSPGIQSAKIITAKTGMVPDENSQDSGSFRESSQQK